MNNSSLSSDYIGKDIIIEKANFFQQLGSNFDTFSLYYYAQTNQLEDIYRSEIPSDLDSNFQNFFNIILNEESDAKTVGGHLRNPSSGAYEVPNPHPFLFEHDDKTYSLIHNGWVSKSALVSLLTENNTDSTWLNNNPPNTFSNEIWSSDIGWENVVDSELLFLWIMKNIILNDDDNVASIVYAIQLLEAIHPEGVKNFVFSDGSLTVGYRSENDEYPDLFYSDQSNIMYQDSLYTPTFISIMSEIPTGLYSNQLNWNAFENESLMIIDNDSGYYFLDDFINHSPEFEISSITQTIWIADTATIFLEASDVDGDSLLFYINDNCPDWVFLDGQSLHFYPDSLGSYHFQVFVSDGNLENALDVFIEIVDYRPRILSITDVPNDNGGWVFIKYFKSYFDNDDYEETEIYHIERFSNNEWISVGSSAAYNSEYYTVQVMTDSDSSYINSGITLFRVIASMNEGIWISEIDSGYSVDNNFLENSAEQYEIFPIIKQNYPNPFNSSTTIEYTLQKKSFIEISIYDINGKLIKTWKRMENRNKSSALTWDGTNTIGKKVSSGIYLYEIRSDNFFSIKKMNLVK
tara:strand:+ start:339 stop:2069 length:1731 start_codon:yes stop_codon:yes gene_type:complete